jgi:diaminopimelate epimerase
VSAGLRITKMSGAGNDFIVLGPEESGKLRRTPEEWARQVCRRGISVGADGVLVVVPTGTDRVRVEFYNPDGAAAFCGNGSRCAARFARLQGWVGEAMILETAAGEIAARLNGERVTLQLPPPRDLELRVLEIEGERLLGRWIAAGVPHWVTFVDSVAGDALLRWGPRVRRHPRFGTSGSNLDLVARRSDGALLIRTWERGVEGETLSCGSGAVAAAFAARLDGGDEVATLIPASGVPLQVTLPGSARSPRAAYLEGDARLIFEARLGGEATL